MFRSVSEGLFKMTTVDRPCVFKSSHYELSMQTNQIR